MKGNSEKHSPLLIKYRTLFEENPKGRVFAPLAETYRKMGLIKEALEVLKQGIKYHPDYDLGHYSVAACYFDQNKYELSYSTLRPIISRNLDNIQMQRLFGQVCSKLDKHDEALETYKYLLFMNPKDDKLAAKVNELENLQKEPTIVEELRPVNFAQLDDEDSDQWVQMDFSKANSQKLDEPANEVSEIPEEVIEKQESRSADVFEVVDKNILAEKTENQTPAAVVKEVAIPQEDESPVITHTLAELYLAQGHFKKALEVLEKFLLLGHNDELTLNKIEEVKKLLASQSPSTEVNEEISLALQDDDEESSGEGEGLILFDEDENEDESTGLVLSDEDEEEPLVQENNDTGHEDLMAVYDQRIASGQSYDLIKAKYNKFLESMKQRAASRGPL